MARTRTQQVEGGNRSTLLQLMGFPILGAADALTVKPNWSAVKERLNLYPTEAAEKDSLRNCNITPIDVNRHHYRGILCFRTWEKYPLLLALINETDPLTKDTLDAFIEAYPEVATSPRSKVIAVAYKNPNTRPEVIETLLKRNLFLCGQERTRVFQMMGFPAQRQEFPRRHDYIDARGAAYQVDWEAMENHLKDHPSEAKIVCPDWSPDSFIFPLEAALLFQHPPIPLSTVQLFLRLCPESTTVNDSTVLYLACTSQKQEDPEVIRAILNTNPSLAASDSYYIHTCGELGLPITEAVNLPCAVRILPDLLRANPSAISSQNQEGSTALQITVDKCIPAPNILRILLEAGHQHPEGFGEEGQLYGYSRGKNGHTYIMDQIIDYTILPLDEVEYGPLRWQNFCQSIKAAGAFKTKMPAEAMWDYPLLHAVIEFGEQQPFFEKIYSETNPDDFTRVDAMGRTPLMVAIEVAGNKMSKNGNSWREEMNLNEVIHMLLDDKKGGSSLSAQIPKANNSNGKETSTTSMLPLHYALRLGLGFDDGIGHIINAFPGALDIIDPETKLLPFLSAAVGPQARVNTIYTLIMERPNLISNLCISANATNVNSSAMEE